MKYYLMVLGCQMNLSDSERVKSVIEAMGFTPTENEAEASLLGVLSCSVRQKPIDKVYNKIYVWNRQKNHRNIITFVSGCVLPNDREKFLKLFDFVFPMSELNDFPNMLKNYGIVTPLSLNHSNSQLLEGGNKMIFPLPSTTGETPFKPIKKLNQNPDKPILPVNQDIFGLWNVKPSYQSSFEAFVPIQNGGDKFCSFCAVPYTRGREISRPSTDILDEIKSLMAEGYKTITLLGQNVNSYGLDREGELSFAQLLQQIGELGNQLQNPCWVYFTSPHPRDMSRDVIETIATYQVLAKQIHLPLQSGDDQVLIKMNRKHNLDRYRESVGQIRELIPQATLFTDIIVGFTGETEEQFQNTLKSFEEFQFNMAYIAMYSPRPGAQSYRWDDDIPPATKKDRLHNLSETLETISFNYNQKLIGSQVKVLVKDKERKTGFLSGYTEGKIVTRIKSKDVSLIGKFVVLQVTEASGFSIAGELVL